MVIRCSRCGEAKLPRFNYMTGEDEYYCNCSKKRVGIDNKEGLEDNNEEDLDIVEVDCPRCDGLGIIKGADDIYECRTCYGEGKIKEEI